MKFAKQVVKISRNLTIAALATSALAATPAIGATSISSSSVGIFSDLGFALPALSDVPLITSLANLSVGSVQGVAPQSYNSNGNVLDATAKTYVLARLAIPPILLTPEILLNQTNLNINAGVINTSAISPLIAGNVATQTGSSAASVADLGINVSTFVNTQVLPITAQVVSISATTITSASSVNAVGRASATGSSNIAGLSIAILGLAPITVDLFASTSTSFTLLDLLGIKIILNEQIPLAATNSKNAGITTNAIHMIFDNYLVGGTLFTGNVIIAQSQAYIRNSTAEVPEPATWIQMIAGFALVGATARRRRHALA